MTTDIEKITDIEDEGRKLTKKEVLFCKWFTGTMKGEDGSATEENITTSALAAGYNAKDAAAMGNKLRGSSAMLMYIATLNKDRKPETMAKVEAYGRRALDTLNELLDSETDSVKLNAAKELVNLSQVRVKDEGDKTQNTLIQMQSAFTIQIEKMVNKLGDFKPDYDKFRMKRAVKARDFGNGEDSGEGDDPIVS